MTQAPIGFLGFGEAGFHIARGLRKAGAPPLVAFDINAEIDPAGERIRARASETGTSLLATPQELALHAGILLSVVTAASASRAAESVASALPPGHIFVDMNSVSPATKQAIAAAIGGGRGSFVEAAIMAPVPGQDHQVPILVNGPPAPALLAALQPYGMRLEAMSGAIGAAAAVKMCRSVVVKGLEALLLESTLAAREYGATERMYQSLSETFPGIDWPRTADYMIGRVFEHGERRAREMEEVAETVRAAGVEPYMAEATARREDWEARSRHDGRLRGSRPATVEAFLELLVK